MKAVIFVCMVMFVLAGCATHPIAMSIATPVPADRVLALVEPTDTTPVRVTVMRDAGFFGSACRIILSVDGKDADVISPGEKATMYVGSGDHILGARPSGKGLCGIGAKAQDRTLKFSASQTDAPTFRVGILSSGDIALSQTAI